MLTQIYKIILFCILGLVLPVDLIAQIGEPIKFELEEDGTGISRPMTVQQCWSTSLDYCSQGNFPHSIAVKDGIIYMPENSPIRNGQYDIDNYIKDYISPIRRYDALSGERLSDLIINPVGMSIDDLDKEWASGMVYVITDDASNLIVVFELGYAGQHDNKTYNVIYGILDCQSGEINDWHSVKVKTGTTNKYTWCYMGLPHFSGDVVAGDFQALIPFTLRQYRANLSSSYYIGAVANFSADDENSTVTLKFISGAPKYGARCHIDYLGNGYFIHDTTFATPGLYNLIQSSDEPLKMLNSDYIESDTKGFTSLNYAGFRFGVNADSQNRYHLYSLTFALNDFNNEPLEGSVNYCCSLSDVNAEVTTTRLMPLADSDRTSFHDGEWSLSTSATSEYGNGTHDIYLYKPGQSLTTYRLGTNDRFTQVDDAETNNAVADTYYYNMQGVKLSTRPVAPGLYIRSTATGSTKILVK